MGLGIMRPRLVLKSRPCLWCEFPLLLELPRLGVVSGESPRLGVSWWGTPFITFACHDLVLDLVTPRLCLSHAWAWKLVAVLCCATPRPRLGVEACDSFDASLFQGVLSLKPIVNYRLLYADTKSRMLAFKRDWNCIVRSYVARVIHTLVHRGQVDNTLKSLLL
ncbi:hypothetical protein PIB30_042323 [Stylosanthes scabra]|uniref:Uncharacterized protein n=1 Tax=Stylosanthes scabra TaxID=79078 RepID=A0ABU6QEV3_9FABA|nr:hypothetical protein [Stylosanthes scabra]